jgi:hypothetical protein
VKIRAIGTGSIFTSQCKNPLMAPCFVVYSDDSHICIGAPATLPAKLNELDILDKISMITLLSPNPDQTAGLFEFAHLYKKMKKKILLAAPKAVIEEVVHNFERDTGLRAADVFEIKAVTKIIINEEHFSDTLVFVTNYSKNSYAVKFEKARVFITGAAKLNEDWIHKHIDYDVILHQIDDSGTEATLCPEIEAIKAVPLYVQKRIWLYGYRHSPDAQHPLPMMLLPPFAWVFNSERKEKLISKERMISENGVKQR